MAGSIQWEWFDEGFHEILNCAELDKVCYETAEKIAHTANSHYETVYVAEHWHSNMKGGRVAAIVGDAGSGVGDELEAQDKALSRAVSACRV